MRAGRSVRIFATSARELASLQGSINDWLQELPATAHVFAHLSTSPVGDSTQVVVMFEIVDDQAIADDQAEEENTP